MLPGVRDGAATAAKSAVLSLATNGPVAAAGPVEAGGVAAQAGRAARRMRARLRAMAGFVLRCVPPEWTSGTEPTRDPSTNGWRLHSEGGHLIGRSSVHMI